MSGGVIELEGDIGNDLIVSSRVQGIIDFYGPTNLTTIMNQSTPHGLGVRGPALALMFGKPPEQAKEELVKASPISYVTKDDPPLFICHGDQDIQVPINQSIELYGKYKETGLKVQMQFVYGAGHGGKQYNDPDLINKVDSFLKSIIEN
jgi:acetyl esterase/lipase